MNAHKHENTRIYMKRHTLTQTHTHTHTSTRAEFTSHVRSVSRREAHFAACETFIQRETERSEYMYVCVRRARAHTHTHTPAETHARARECAGTTCIEAEKLIFLQRSRSSSGSFDRDAGLRCLLLF